MFSKLPSTCRADCHGPETILSLEEWNRSSKVTLRRIHPIQWASTVPAGPTGSVTRGFWDSSRLKCSKPSWRKKHTNKNNFLLADHRNWSNDVYKDKQEASFCINYSAQSSAVPVMGVGGISIIHRGILNAPSCCHFAHSSVDSAVLTNFSASAFFYKHILWKTLLTRVLLRCFTTIKL